MRRLLRRREREKEQRRQIKAYEDLRTQFETYRAQQAHQAQQPPQKPIPAFEEDPLTHMQERLKQVDQVAQNQQMMMMQQARNNQIQQIKQSMEFSEANFRKEHPDYDQAVSHITNIKMQELAELGMTDPIQARQILAQNAIGLWQQSAAIGKNPPEVVYALAQKYGYRTAAPAVPQSTTSTAPVEQIQQKMETQQQADLKAIAAGQQAATKTLSGSGKTTNDTEISIQAMLDADPAEFDKMWKEKFKNAK